MTAVPLAEQIAAVDRAAQGGGIELRAAAATLRLLAEHEADVRNTLRAALQRRRFQEEAASIAASNPLVAEIQSVFPGAEIESIHEMEDEA